MPRLRSMDRMVVVRSIADSQAEHDAFQSYTGATDCAGGASGAWPTIGAAAAKVQGPVDPGVPPYVSLCYPCTHPPYNEPGPGFLGVANSPFRPLGDGREDLVLRGSRTIACTIGGDCWQASIDFGASPTREA